MKKGVITLILTLALVIPLTSASLPSNFETIENYISQYESGEINAPQLIVYIEYTKGKMYEELDKENKKAFTETEIKSIFEKVEENNNNFDYRKSEYEKKFETNDFHIVFDAHQFFRRDRSYYEEREDDDEKLYIIDYNLVAIDLGKEGTLKEELNNFLTDLESLIETRDDDEYILVQEKFSKIKSKFWSIRDQESCAKIMEGAGMIEQEKDYPSKERSFSKIIKEMKEENCWNEGGECNQICEDREVCNNDTYTTCNPTEKCEEVCEKEDVCEDIGNETICADVETCEDVCTTENVCEDVNDQNCYTEQDCYEECDEGEEKCDEWTNGEIRLEGNCREDGSDLWLNSWSNNEEFNYFQGIGEGGEWNCENEIENLVTIRKVLQKDINDEFATWYFEEFLQEDYDRILNGENGLREVIWRLIRNEEEIANRLYCSETKEWPQGFEKIDITYKKDNVNLEVWEKMIPIEWDNQRYYTTLFKYSWIPDKELMKGLIDYKLSETNTLGPSAKDVAGIKSDEGKMEIVNRLSEKYGGSLDVKLELIEDKENIITKYLQINPDVAMKISDEAPEKIDISIEIDYDTLYDFATYMSYTMEGDRIEGPNWVFIENNEGPGKFFSVIGAVSKMWREGITIKPRYALLKMFFSAGDIIELMSGRESSNYQAENSVKMSGNAILTKDE